MKKKNYPLFAVIVAMVIIIIVGIVKGGMLMVAEEKEDSKSAEPLVIDIPEPTQEGKITVFDKNSEIVFDYQGDFIKIVSDGKNGEPIEIKVNIPYDHDSCFQEGDDLSGQ